jgi:hypothetical protein
MSFDTKILFGNKYPEEEKSSLRDKKYINFIKKVNPAIQKFQINKADIKESYNEYSDAEKSTSIKNISIPYQSFSNLKNSIDPLKSRGEVEEEKKRLMNYLILQIDSNSKFEAMFKETMISFEKYTIEKTLLLTVVHHHLKAIKYASSKSYIDLIEIMTKLYSSEDNKIFGNTKLIGPLRKDIESEKYFKYVMAVYTIDRVETIIEFKALIMERRKKELKFKNDDLLNEIEKLRHLINLKKLKSNKI